MPDPEIYYWFIGCVHGMKMVFLSFNFMTRNMGLTIGCCNVKRDKPRAIFPTALDRRMNPRESSSRLQR